MEILSKLRKLQKQTIQTIKQMGWEYELETDIRFLQGVKKGEKKGIATGIATGIEKSKIEFIKNLLMTGISDVAQISKLVGESIEFVENVKKDLAKEK